QFLGAQPHPELCAPGEPFRQGNGRGPHRAQRVFRLPRQLGTARAVLQMRVEPFALALRDAFDARLRDQLCTASMQLRAHLENSPCRGAACCALVGTIATVAEAFCLFLMPRLPGALPAVLPVPGTGATSLWKGAH